MALNMAACGGLLGLVYRQIHPGFCGSGHVWGPVIHHKPSLVPSVPIVPMGTHRLVCDGPQLWPPVDGCLNWSMVYHTLLIRTLYREPRELMNIHRMDMNMQDKTGHTAHALRDCFFTPITFDA